MDDNNHRINLLKLLLKIETIFLFLCIIVLILFNIYVENPIIIKLSETITSTIFLCFLFTIIYLLLVKNDLDPKNNLEMITKTARIKNIIVSLFVVGGFLLIIVSNYTRIFSSNNEILKYFTEIGATVGNIMFILGMILTLFFF